MNSKSMNSPQIPTEQAVTQEVDDSQLGFFRKLAYRRVPQVMGFYLAGAWTFLEFFESLISRYNISPHWQDISLLVIVLLFPSVLILAYRHGAPGVQDWTRVEKFGIPTNILVTLLIIVNQFADKDLGSSAEIIKGLGPDGTVIELQRPKAEFRKRLSISFFDIKNKTVNEYLALGIPVAVKYDLSQDPYLNVFDPTDLAREIKQSDYRGLKVPMSLMLNIAKNNRIEYLLTGQLSTIDERIVLSGSLYKVADGSLIKKIKTTDHADVFSAIDDFSVQIKSAMGFSGGHINNTVDLPINEQLTDSMPAFIAFVRSNHAQAFNDDFPTSEAELKRAIELDNSFARASSQYAMQLLQQTRTEEGLKVLKLAQKHNYRLTDSSKFALAAIESLYMANPESARNIINQWLELYPEDVNGWTMKYWLHSSFDERLEAIEVLRKIIELEPFGTHQHLTIGKIYTSLGDIQSALEEYQIFTAKNPANAKGHLLVGDSKRTLGQFKSAREEYQQAKMLLSNDLTADRNLANLLIREGNFQQAEQQIEAYLKSSKIPQDEYISLREMASFYWLRGQQQQSINTLRNSYSVLKAFSPETSYLMVRSMDSWRFAAAGYPEEALKIIEDARMQLQTNNSDIYKTNIKISQAILYAGTGKTKQATKLLNEAAATLTSYIGSGIDDNISMFEGIVLYFSQDYASAAKSIAIFLQKNPTDQIEIMSMMADALLKSGQINLAEQSFTKILREFPAHPSANFGMAKIAISRENPDSARSYLDKALKGWQTADETFEPAIEARKIAIQLEGI